MRACQSADQLVAGAWTGSQGTALPTVSGHRAWPTLYEHGPSSACQAVSGGTDGRDANVKESPAPRICALTRTAALKLRAASSANICARNDYLQTVSFYDDNGNPLSRVVIAADQALYQWDFENRLVGAEITEGGVTRHVV